eukprot:gnl/MRDRNA2_/MRDRNA2_18803_c0_seq2.p1 gnl/MRDRNA2_/MRDRNA2_18803_c0~~gnl/MRDRNA2_/MRDRNA2_18803_c0_seq2.p1  ORF type:complete len:295 (-),score=58.53 gnl/MRDRNA2_/MRDRNA2_18803_c0_seq2:376-1260(-)
MESQCELILAALPGEVLRRAVQSAGIKSLLQFSAVTSQFQEFCKDDGIWDEMSRSIWPPETLPPTLQVGYATAYGLVKDGNRQGAWLAWVPNGDEELRWFWKYNNFMMPRNHFYCGKITQIAINLAAGEMCFYIHAVASFPDLRPASSSSLYVLRPNRDLEFGSLPTPKHKILHQRLLDGGVIEEKTILKWKLDNVQRGYDYIFFYATTGAHPEHSDYPGTPIDGMKLDQLLRVARGSPHAECPEGMKFIAPDSDEALEPLERRFPFSRLQHAFPEHTFTEPASEADLTSAEFS